MLMMSADQNIPLSCWMFHPLQWLSRLHCNMHVVCLVHAGHWWDLPGMCQQVWYVQESQLHPLQSTQQDPTRQMKGSAAICILVDWFTSQTNVNKLSWARKSSSILLKTGWQADTYAWGYTTCSCGNSKKTSELDVYIVCMNRVSRAEQRISKRLYKSAVHLYRPPPPPPPPLHMHTQSTKPMT